MWISNDGEERAGIVKEVQSRDMGCKTGYGDVIVIVALELYALYSTLMF